MYYVYVLLSLKDGKFYTGCTKDLEKRIKEHKEGKVNSTKYRKPLVLLYYEACLNRYDAYRREKYLKSTRGRLYLKNRLRYYSASK